MYDRQIGRKSYSNRICQLSEAKQLSRSRNENKELKRALKKDSQRKTGLQKLASSGLCLALLLSQSVPDAMAESGNKSTPSGTLLLPLTPKLDVDDPAPSAIAPVSKKAKPRKIAVSSSSDAARSILGTPPEKIQPAKPGSMLQSPVPPAGSPLSVEISTDALKEGTLKTEKAELADPEEPDIEKLEEANDNMLLKGTVQIVADDTEYDQQKNTFLGTGNAIATIAGQDARLEADMILYDQNTEMLDARGNVKIVRQGQVSTGSSFKFQVNKDEYLITSPDTEIQGTQVIARTGYGTKDGIRFRQGTLELDQPIHVHRNSFNGTLSSMQDAAYKDLHPDAYVNENSSFVFKARKMVYERYKESGNLTIFGGKMMFGKFGVPVGKLNATVGKESSVTFPVTPFISNNIMVGGINVGPMFNTALPKGRVFSWAPLVQYGGRNTSGTNTNLNGNVGAGFRLAFRGKKMSANLAYGSVSNLLVGDVRYNINPNSMFQAGINRFIPNGLFGSQRARAIAEFVDIRGIGNVPFVQGLSFRSSAGWASDAPSLLNTTPEYKQLFNVTSNNITNGYRLQEQVMTSSHPFFSVGNQRVGATMNLFGGAAGRGYSTGDTMLMGQVGPILNLNLDRFRLQTSVMKTAVRGQSPFVFDQFIQGSKSAQLGGDVKVCRWLAIGGNLGYNLDNKLYYQKGITAAIGPEDFKFLVSHDTIRGINRFGFDFMYGQPIPFNKLIMKGSPDHGQLGGI